MKTWPLKPGDAFDEPYRTKDYVRTSVVTGVRDTDQARVIRYRYVIRYKDGSPTTETYHSERQQKFLCVGGPQTGARLTEGEALGYTRYNVCSRFFPSEEEAALFERAVLVHKSAFEKVTRTPARRPTTIHGH